jgi:hypothetical protein
VAWPSDGLTRPTAGPRSWGWPGRATRVLDAIRAARGTGAGRVIGLLSAIDRARLARIPGKLRDEGAPRR